MCIYEAHFLELTYFKTNISFVGLDRSILFSELSGYQIQTQIVLARLTHQPGNQTPNWFESLIGSSVHITQWNSGWPREFVDWTRYSTSYWPNWVMRICSKTKIDQKEVWSPLRHNLHHQWHQYHILEAVNPCGPKIVTCLASFLKARGVLESDNKEKKTKVSERESK